MLTPFIATIAYQVFPETSVTHVADHGSPWTVPVVVTIAPVGIVTRAAAVIEGEARRRAEQAAA